MPAGVMNMESRHLIFDDIPFEPDLSALETGAFFSGDISDALIVSAWEEATRVVRPKAVVSCVDVQHGDDGNVVSVGGQPVNSVVLNNNLGKLHRVFAYVATCGTEIAVLDRGSDPDVRSALTTFRMLALRAAIAYATGKVQTEYNIRKLAMLNPGSLPEWPITEQTKLFAMIGNAEDATGVKLGTNMFMTPMESSSGLMFETEHDYKNCMVCTRLDCIGRQAEYDGELAKQYR